MQGSAADIIKKAMLLLADWAKEHDDTVSMIMQVHDELVFEVPAAQLEVAVPEIRNRMERAAKLSVPLLVDVGIGDNWDEAH